MSWACFSISRWELCRSWILVKKWCERRWHITLCPHATHGVKKGRGGASIDRTASAEGSFLKDKIPRKSWCARVIGPPRTAYRFNLVDLCRCFSILLPHGSRTTVPSTSWALKEVSCRIFWYLIWTSMKKVSVSQCIRSNSKEVHYCWQISKLAKKMGASI